MKRTLIVLLAALAVLAGILLKKRSNETALRKDAPVLDSAYKAGVSLMRIVKKPDTTTMVKKEGKWVVAKDSYSVDTAKIAKALTHIFSLQNKELVSNSPARLAEYGLDTVEAKHVTIEDGAGKTLAKVAIGKTSGSDFSSTYWKWEDKPEVYRTPGNFAWEFASKEDEWKDRKLFAFVSKDVKSIETSWKDTTGIAYAYELQTITDSTWKMLAPQDSNRVNNVSANEMASRFAELTVDEFVAVGDTNVAKVELDTPAVYVKVGLKDGTTRELKASKVLGAFAYLVHPSRASSGVRNAKDMVKLSAWRFDAFKKKPFELLEAPPAPKADTALPVQSTKIGIPSSAAVKEMKAGQKP